MYNLGSGSIFLLCEKEECEFLLYKEMTPLIGELDQLPAFHSHVCYYTYMNGYSCQNCNQVNSRWIDNYGHIIEINRCESCVDDVNRQLKSYKNNQINKYILCLLVLDTIVIKDISKVIIGKYYKNYGILNV